MKIFIFTRVIVSILSLFLSFMCVAVIVAGTASYLELRADDKEIVYSELFVNVKDRLVDSEQYSSAFENLSNNLPYGENMQRAYNAWKDTPEEETSAKDDEPKS